MTTTPLLTEAFARSGDFDVDGDNGGDEAQRVPRDAYCTLFGDDSHKPPHHVAVIVVLVVAFFSLGVLSGRATKSAGSAVVPDDSGNNNGGRSSFGPGPTTRTGAPIPQVLWSNVMEHDQDIRITGSWWESMAVKPIAADKTVHVCIDMQPLFYDARSPWGGPDGLAGSVMRDLLSPIRRLVAALGTANNGTSNGGDASTQSRLPRHIFTQFVPPIKAADAHGYWKYYYNESAEGKLTLSSMGSNSRFFIRLMPQLQDLTPPGEVVNKTTFGAFNSGGLRRRIEELSPSTIIITGVETDMCVAATVLDAVDLGFRVIVATDAIGSSQRNSHLAFLDYTLRRFDHQIELGTVDEIIAALQPH